MQLERSTAQAPGVCPRCGARVQRRSTGRPATWCSTRCRRAAYEARRAARSGEIAIRIVERVVLAEPDLTECASRVAASPGACRRVLAELVALAEKEALTKDRRWDSARREAEKLAKELLSSGRDPMRRSRWW